MSLWTFGAGPGTHAFVVGVGDYPWLLGGSQPPFAQNEGMGQLTSSPPSALAFAAWLASPLGYRSVSHPLRSMEVLISAAGQGPWAPQSGMPPEVPTRATMANFRSALLAWHARLTADDRAIFFFSGHGIGAGLNHTLVMEDYGSNAAASMSYAFDFTRFHVGMASAPAKEQSYFLDACRVSSGAMVRNGSYGEAILNPSTNLPSPPRSQPALYAAMPGAAAYGRPGKTSLFTEALLESMRGAGALRRGGAWKVTMARLYEGVGYHLRRLGAPYGADLSCNISHLGDFELHALNGLPDVPVIVDCCALKDPATVAVTINGPSANRDHPPPVPSPWHLELPHGTYRFAATGSPARDEFVFPPVTEVTFR